MKKIVCLLLALVMLGSIAVTAADDNGLYVALGDSIGAGYGLPGYVSDANDPEGSYASIIAREKGMKLNNLSVSGMNSTQLLTWLSLPQYSNAIKEAELITLSIGSNDLLIPAMGILTQALGGGGMFFDFGAAFGTELSDTMKTLGKLDAALASEESKKIFEDGCSTFEGNWEKIITAIRELNPDAQIAVTGYYNPYSMLDVKVGLEEVKISSFINGYIDRLNEHVKNSELKDEYVFAEVSDVTTNVRVFVVDASMFSFDPHPDADGHALMAERLLEVINAADAENAEDAENTEDIENTEEAAEPVVVRSNQTVTVDGERVLFDVYNIDGNNYFKLRDIAMKLGGTAASFGVGYDEQTRTVTCTTGAAYEPNGSELVIGDDLSATAVRSNQPIYIDGELSSIKAFNIGGNNFFQLRELGEALGFGVDYDEATRTVLITAG